MTRKVTFTKSGEIKAVKNTTVIGSSYNLIVHYRTIEITNINPSQLVMNIRKVTGLTETTTISIPLVDFRTRFIKEDEKYILDVNGLTRFIDSEISTDVQVSFNAIDENAPFNTIDENAPFNVELFYMLEDSTTFKQHSNILAKEAAEMW